MSSPEPVSPLQIWTPVAEKLPSDDLKIPVPLHVLYGEAVDVAKFYDRYHAKTADRPGLESVADKRRHLTKETGKQLLSLREAAEKANIDYLLTVAPGSAAPVARAVFVINEISSTLEWLFDDGIEDERDLQLASLKRAYDSNPDSHDAWAAELVSWAALGTQYKDEIDGLGGFDVALLDEAVTLAAALRDRPAIPAVTPAETAKARALRNRLAMLLWSRMSTVRAAARFVFRGHPEIVREATSTYERRRKAANRRNAAKPAEQPS